MPTVQNANRTRAAVSDGRRRVDAMLVADANGRRGQVSTFCVVLGSLLALVCGAYWPVLRAVTSRWSTDPQYSHGYLVPLFCLFLLWHRREKVTCADLKPSWRGLPLFVAGGLLHVAGTYFYYEWFEAFGFILALAGAFVCAGGSTAFRWSWVAIAFLVFMLPLPYRIETSLSHPLRRIATLASTYVLQTLGFPSVAEGNVILMENTSIGVVEACNGLGMLMTFFALTAGLSLVSGRSRVVRVVLVLSAVPIALVANTLRIVTTAIFAVTFSAEVAAAFFHDFAGAFMIPMALALAWIELLLISKLFLEAPSGPRFSFAKANPAPHES